MPSIPNSFNNLILLDFNMLEKLYKRIKLIDNQDLKLYSSDDSDPHPFHP